MPKLPKDKVGVYLYIDRKLFEQFKRLCFQKYEKFHGALSYEVEQALQSWIALHTQDTHKVGAVNPQPRVYKVFNQVKEVLKERFGYSAIVPQLQIPRIHLVEAITCVRGVDERTVNTWMSRFQKFKLIKHVGGELFEVL
jgi:uncharacterized protein YcgL (UPF0745 family)